MQIEGFGRQEKRPLQASLTNPWIMQQHLQTVLILCPLAHEFQDSRQSGFNYLLSIFPSNKVVCILLRYSVPLANQNGVVFFPPIESSSPWNICRPVGGHGNFHANWLPEQPILVSTNMNAQICRDDLWHKKTNTSEVIIFQCKELIQYTSHPRNDNWQLTFSLLAMQIKPIAWALLQVCQRHLMKYCEIQSFNLFI